MMTGNSTKNQNLIHVVCLAIPILITIGLVILGFQIKNAKENKILTEIQDDLSEAQQAFKDKNYFIAKEYYKSSDMREYCGILYGLTEYEKDLEQDGYVYRLNENYWNDAITKIDSIKDTLDDEVVTPEQAEAVKKEIKEYIAKAKKCNKNKTKEQDEEIKKLINIYDIDRLIGFESKYLEYHVYLSGCEHIKINEEGNVNCESSGEDACIIREVGRTKVHYDYRIEFYLADAVDYDDSDYGTFYCNNEGYVVAQSYNSHIDSFIVKK